MKQKQPQCITCKYFGETKDGTYCINERGKYDSIDIPIEFNCIRYSSKSAANSRVLERKPLLKSKVHSATTQEQVVDAKGGSVERKLSKTEASGREYAASSQVPQQTTKLTDISIKLVNKEQSIWTAEQIALARKTFCESNGRNGICWNTSFIELSKHEQIVKELNEIVKEYRIYRDNAIIFKVNK